MSPLSIASRDVSYEISRRGWRDRLVGSAFRWKLYYVDDDESVSEGPRVKFETMIAEDVERIMRGPPYNVSDSDLLGLDNATLEQRSMNAVYDAH